MLLQVLEEASVAEVVDVSTEKHQFRVDVIGHTVVGGHCVAYSGWHNEGGGTVEYAVPTAFYQGTKSERGNSTGVNYHSLLYDEHLLVGELNQRRNLKKKCDVFHAS